MKDILHGAFKIIFWAVLLLTVALIAAVLSAKQIISPKIAVVLIFSVPFFACAAKMVLCGLLIRRGLPATAYLNAGNRVMHLRFRAADGTEHKGSCDLLTRRVLKHGGMVQVWYDAVHPDRFTTGQRDIIVHAMFCVVFAIIPVYLLIRL